MYGIIFFSLLYQIYTKTNMVIDAYVWHLLCTMVPFTQQI